MRFTKYTLSDHCDFTLVITLFYGLKRDLPSLPKRSEIVCTGSEPLIGTTRETLISGLSPINSKLRKGGQAA